MNNFDRVIKNGVIITASDTYKADIAVKDEKIAAIGADLTADEIIDAKDKYVLPGGVDVHTHLDMPTHGLVTADDFATGSKAAAIGGTTSFIDYACQLEGGTLRDALDMWKSKAAKSCLDYGLHIGLTDARDSTLEEMPLMMEAGVTSFKVYMLYDMRLNDGEFMRVLEKARDCGALITVHCENYFVVKHKREALLTAGMTAPKYHPVSRPAECEGEAANRAIKLAEMTGAKLYIVHNTCAESVSRIKEAREKGLPVMGETCPQYLTLSVEKYDEPDFGGAKYVMSPPLRDRKNNEYLWRQLKAGILQTVATDHCSFTLEQKKLGRYDFSKIPNGGTGIETRMPLLLSEGPKHGLSLNKIVEISALNPAKIFGLYPQKGAISVGSDADIVIYDPTKKVTLGRDVLHENVDYSVFDGMELTGYPVMTLSRGDIVAQDGRYTGEEGRGRFIKRGLPTLL